uniref:DSBA-like thioredoxin domain-containing protein n=1 Tax=Panagrolaimus sp. JU765 TaxID=591449 RepID=A0AC34QIP0_9BILA
MKETKSIKCFIDVASAHAWFAFEALLNEKAKQNFKLDFVPVHAASVMTTIGHKMPYYDKILRDYNFYDIKVETKSIKCFIDVASAHAWFAFEALLNEKAKQNFKLDFVPVHAASIMTTIGHKMPYYDKILRDYNFYDIKVVDKMYGVNINVPSNGIDRLSNIGTFNAMRFASAVKETDPERYEATCRKLFQRLWSEDKEIYQRQDFEEVGRDVKLDNQVFEILDDSKWTIQVKKNNEVAISLGCFGVPWIQVEKSHEFECFFGADRIPLIKKYLQVESAN